MNLNVSTVRHYPNYPGRWFRRRSSRAIRWYARFASLIRWRDTRLRRRVARELCARAKGGAARIPTADGYLVLDGAQIEAVRRAIPGVRARLDKWLAEPSGSDEKKPFLRVRELPLSEEANKDIVALALQPELLVPVSEYLGGIPVVGMAALWYSPNDSFHGSSQFFHLDAEDARQIKCFLFLDDVDAQSGPFTLIPASHSREAIDRIPMLRKGGHNKKVEDRDIFSSVSQKETKALTGPKGTIALVDTTNCLHFGSRPGERPRALLMIHYYSGVSSELPLLGWGGRRPHKSSFDNALRELVIERGMLSFPLLSHRKTRP